MSAECSKCGSDIVYPEGTWPIGECQVCYLRAAVERYAAALREFNAEAQLSLVRPGRLLEWKERFATLEGDKQ